MPKIISRTAAQVAGLKHYFTGKPCRRGHITYRYVSTAGCKQCQAVYAPATRAWQEANSEQVKEKSKAWRAAHPGYGREWYLANKEEALEQARSWYQANKQRRNAASKAWERANATARAAIAARYRARLASAEGYFTQDDVERILEEQGYHCANPNCRADLLRRFDIDHKTPISRGGSNWPENLQCLCHSCNTSKGDKTMEEWSGAAVKPKRRRRLFSG